MRVGLVTLGCDKNTVDNEYLSGLLGEKGITVEMANQAHPPDVVVITTCGFILDAKDQSIEEITRWLKIRKTKGTRVGVIGCLAQRQGSKLLRQFPNIDFLAGVGDFERVARMVAGEEKSQFLSNVNGESWELKTQSAAVQENAPTADESTIEFDDRQFETDAPRVVINKLLPRRRIDRRPHGFLKISDGCNHTCTFCSIPMMKGIYTSVPRPILLDEAKRLIDDGVKEINIVAQDITKYGLDTEKKLALPDLLKELCALDGEFWIRLFYLYPSTVTKDLVQVMKEEKKIVRYLDIPLQHLDDKVLTRMRRPHNRTRTMEMLKMIRQQLPDVTLRTTFIVGFPGETRQEYQTLVDAVEKIKFERLGVFAYSKEVGTPAASLRNHLTDKIKERRKEKLMKKQKAISAKWAEAQIGSIRECLIEGPAHQKGWYIARSHSEAADIDGIIRLHSEENLPRGSFVQAKITEADAYDLVGETL